MSEESKLRKKVERLEKEKKQWKALERQTLAVTKTLAKYKSDLETLQASKRNLESLLKDTQQEKRAAEEKYDQKAKNFQKLADIAHALKERLEAANQPVQSNNKGQKRARGQEARQDKEVASGDANRKKEIRKEDWKVDNLLHMVWARMQVEGGGELNDATVRWMERQCDMVVNQQGIASVSCSRSIDTLASWSGLFRTEPLRRCFVVLLSLIATRAGEPVWNGVFNRVFQALCEGERTAHNAQLLGLMCRRRRARLAWIKCIAFCCTLDRSDLLALFSQLNWPFDAQNRCEILAACAVLGDLMRTVREAPSLSLLSSLAKGLVKEVGVLKQPEECVEEIIEQCEQFRHEDQAVRFASLRVICEHFQWDWTYRVVVKGLIWPRFAARPERSGSIAFRLLGCLAKDFHFVPRPPQGAWLRLYDTIREVLPPDGVDGTDYLTDFELLVHAFLRKCLGDLKAAHVRDSRLPLS